MLKGSTGPFGWVLVTIDSPILCVHHVANRTLVPRQDIESSSRQEGQGSGSEEKEIIDRTFLIGGRGLCRTFGPVGQDLAEGVALTLHREQGVDLGQRGIGHMT
jgi:hypothetical protein